MRRIDWLVVGVAGALYVLYLFAVAAWAAPPATSCADYWAAHPFQDAHTYNREHHIRAKCTP